MRTREIVLRSPISIPLRFTAEGGGSFRVALRQPHSNEPPDWYYPARESLGAALLLDGDAAAAEKVFREDLKENPRNARSLFGLMESLKAQGNHDAATFVEAEFKAAWKNAEVRLKVEGF